MSVKVKNVTALAERSLPSGHHACKRCGVVRKARASTTLCSDCVDVLSPSDARAWRDAA